MRSAERINFAVVAVTATLFLAIAAFVAFSTSKMMENEAHRTVENVVKATVGRIDRQMASVESAVENSAWVVAERISDPDYMFRITGELVHNNPRARAQQPVHRRPHGRLRAELLSVEGILLLRLFLQGREGRGQAHPAGRRDVQVPWHGLVPHPEGIEEVLVVRALL